MPGEPEGLEDIEFKEHSVNYFKPWCDRELFVSENKSMFKNNGEQR